MNRPDIAVFLDRDGTVNVEKEYLSSPDELQLLPRSSDAIRELNALGARVFVITNQSGIARGFYTEEAVEKVHAAMRALLKKNDAFIDDFFFCPHLPGAKDKRYDKECDCRKPKPGMLHQAEHKYAIDLRRSFVVGDRCIDVEAGKAVGAGTVMVATGYGSREIDACRNEPDFFAEDLYAGVQYIRERISGQERPITQSRNA
ncbi:MAG TPA: HAD family hydrolase [Bacteroidota bacterium]|nr:HAD family hydrolase [Bacteroidota bacterium]